MPQSSFVHPLFGTIVFRTQSNTWIRGDKIFFISGFDESAVTRVVIPELARIPGAGSGVLNFHANGHAQLQAVFQDIDRNGLLHHVKTCAGSLHRRLRKPTDGSLSKLPSNHAFGIAIDLNSDDGSLGASVAPLAPIFEAHGFKCGKAFNDPMHFEVSRFIPEVAPVLAAAPLPNSEYIACRQPVANRGIFQCSGNSMSFSPTLKLLLVGTGADGTCASFIDATKTNHAFAIEYCAASCA